MLREMKDMKKAYRDMFSELKNFKEDNHDAQQQIDVLKEKLIINFENWYRETFDVMQGGNMAFSMDEQQVMSNTQIEGEAFGSH